MYIANANKTSPGFPNHLKWEVPQTPAALTAPEHMVSGTPKGKNKQTNKVHDSPFKTVRWKSVWSQLCTELPVFLHITQASLPAVCWAQPCPPELMMMCSHLWSSLKTRVYHHQPRTTPTPDSAFIKHTGFRLRERERESKDTWQHCSASYTPLGDTAERLSWVTSGESSFWNC